MSEVNKTTPPATSAGAPDSYKEYQLMNQYLSGSLVEPHGTTAGTLQSLQLLSDLMKNSDSMPPALRAITKQEVAWVMAGCKAISESKEIRDKYGGGLQGAFAVSSWLQRMNAEDRARALLSKYTTPDDVPSAQTVARSNPFS